MLHSNRPMARHAGAIFVACLALAATIDTARADPKPACEITFYGLVAETDAEPSTPGAGSATGNATSFDVANFEPEPTPLVPAVLGTHFGVVRKLAHIPAGENAELVISHPLLTTPDGKRLARTVVPAVVASLSDAYRFDEPYEVVPGDWTFEYFYKGERLCRKVFHVIPIEFR